MSSYWSGSDEGRAYVSPAAVFVSIFVGLLSIYGVLLGGSAVLPEAIPGPSDIYAELSGGLWEHRYFAGRYREPGLIPAFFSTVKATVGSLVIGACVAIAGVVLLFPVVSARNAALGIANFFRAIPPLAGIPVMIILFGQADAVTMFGVPSLYAAFCYFVFLVTALEIYEDRFKDLLKLLGTPWYRAIIVIYMPAMTRDFLRGTRLIFPITLGIVLVSEYFQDVGLGFVLRIAQAKANLTLIVTTILMAMALVIVAEILMICASMAKMWRFGLRWA